MSGNPNLEPMRKRKKHAPDRQQPEWLFPADEENPALKPHQEPTLEERHEKQKSIDFLKRRAVGAPTDKPAPPVQLLNLIGAFLAEYGFKSTGRLFSAEREARSKLDGWKGETSGKIEKGMPTLSKIYKEWRKEWDERRLLDMTSSDEEDDAATKREKMLKRKKKIEQQKKVVNDDVTSSSGSDSSGEDSDVEMKDAPSARKAVTGKPKHSSASPSSSSDSDADDEKEAPAPRTIASKSNTNILKRKASPQTSSSSASSSSSSPERDAPQTKKAKTVQESSSSASESTSDDDKMVDDSGAVKAGQSSSDTSSTSDSDSSSNLVPENIPLPASSDSDSSSESDSDSSDKETKKKPVVSSDTSATLSDGPRKASPGSSNSNISSSNSNINPKSKSATQQPAQNLPQPVPSVSTTKPPRKKTNEPFSRIPKDIKVDEKLASNAYVPYDYAQKAHRDLIVTKGKGFTKEKNKKKRGSYKGGYIDVEGKKGIKFDD